MIKGYNVDCGYMGYISEERRYMLFASEADYLDYVKEISNETESGK